MMVIPINVGFFHVETEDDIATEQGYECARALVVSVHAVLPGTPVVHFTDTVSKGVKGAVIKRKPREPMALLRMRHHAGVEGNWLFVDTDVLVQQSIRPVFKREFDIGVTTRDWSHLKAAYGFSERMPFNMGVVFSKCPRFWAECYTRLRWLEPELQEWMGDQEVFCDAIKDAQETGRYLVRQLKGSLYNYPPPVPLKEPSTQEMLAAACIVHYKGPERKALMLARIRGERRRCA